MVYWTVPKRTVTRLGVTSHLPVNDDAPDIGLITPRDLMWMSVLAGVTILMLIGGWVYMAAKYPVRLPQQTDRFAPEPLAAGPHLAEVRSTGATYDDGTDTLLITAEVKNAASSPITLKQYAITMATVLNGGTDEKPTAGPTHSVGHLAF